MAMRVFGYKVLCELLLDCENEKERSAYQIFLIWIVFVSDFHYPVSF